MVGERVAVPSVSVSYARTGASTKTNELGMRPMQEGVAGPKLRKRTKETVENLGVVTV